MALHTLPAGRSVIEGLEVLGTALEYEVEKEWPIGQARAAVDLAWFATEDRRVALMIFEVESSASASMANNAMKVLARDVEDFIKPLFFFHVLLSGGPDNERIRLLREQWGKHNYRVYRLLDDCEFRRLVVDILGQHRRIRSDVSVGALWHSLRHAAWSTVPPGGALDEVQQQGFKGNYLRDLSRLALEDEDALAYFLQHLYAVATGKRHRDEDQEYGGYVAYHYEQFLESAILIHTGYISDASGPDRMEAWQQRSGYGMRTIGPYFGLSRDYDVFVLGIAPFLYGLCGVLVCDRPRTMAWCIRDLDGLVQEELQVGVHKEYVLPGAIWLAHLASSALMVDGAERRGVLAEAYARARDVINGFGGVPVSVIDDPPVYVDADEPDEWLGRIEGTPYLLPGWRELNGRYVGGGIKDLRDWDPVRAAVAVLLGDDWVSWSAKSAVLSLRARA